MDIKIHYKTLPNDMKPEEFKLDLAQLLDGIGWLTGSGEDPAGSFVELELEEERNNPKYGIIALKNHLQNIGIPEDATMEMDGIVVGVYE